MNKMRKKIVQEEGRKLERIKLKEGYNEASFFASHWTFLKGVLQIYDGIWKNISLSLVPMVIKFMTHPGIKRS